MGARHAAKRPSKHTTARSVGGFRQVLKNPVFFVPVGLLVIVIAAGVTIVGILATSVAVAQTSLQAAAPLASQLKDEILAGDSDAAKQTVAEFDRLTHQAEDATNHPLWKTAESVPGVGENMRAVRLVSSAAATLSSDVFTPAAELGFSTLKKPGGGLNARGIADLVPLIENAVVTAEAVSAELATLDQSQLVEPVRGAVAEFQTSIDELNEFSEPALKVLRVLPDMLGANGPKNYLLLFPNNAEVRSGIGNPGAIAMITIDNGDVEITQQASAQDFGMMNFKLDPDTRQIYGSRVGAQIQDITYTPFFDETAGLARQFWAERFDTPIDAVVMFDPVALSYLLEATGPVKIANDEELTSENAVPLLLNEVYFRYPDVSDFAEQNAFFDAATTAIFQAVTKTDNIGALLQALAKGAEEGRLMYYSDNEAQMELIKDTRVVGPLPATNEKETVVGVFFNFVLAGKLDYYMDSSVVGETTQCTVTGDQRATFTTTTTLTNILTPKEGRKLPEYISGTDSPLNQNGGIYRDVVVYGPVGTKVKSVKVDGRIKNYDQTGGSRWGDNYRVLEHRDRPVAQIPIFVDAEKTATVTVVFEAAKDQPAESFGKFEVRTTPTVRQTPVTVNRPGCE